VNRTLASLDLNPLLINTLNNLTTDATGLLGDVVGDVDGLLGSITQGGTTLNLVVDNLGNIVQQVNGVSSIVGDYLQNMTYTGTSTSVGSGLTQKTYSYSPLNALVNIVFNTAGQVRPLRKIEEIGCLLTGLDRASHCGKGDRKQQLQQHEQHEQHCERNRRVEWHQHVIRSLYIMCTLHGAAILVVLAMVTSPSHQRRDEICFSSQAVSGKSV